MVWCCYCESKLFFKSFCQHVIEYPASVLSNVWLERLKRGKFWSSLPLQLPSLSAEPGALEILPMTVRSVRGCSSSAVGSHSSLSIPASGPPPPWDSNPRELHLNSWMEVSEGNQPWHLRKKWFHSSCLAAMPALPLLPWDCQPGECFSPSLTSMLCWATAATTSSPPLSFGTLPPKLAGELQVFLFSGGKFHLTLSSGTRTDIRFVDDEVLLSEFNRRGTMKRLQPLSKSTTPITKFMCIYKWHSSEGPPHPTDVPSFHRKLVNLSLSSACSTYLCENAVFDCLATSCNDRTDISR